MPSPTLPLTLTLTLLTACAPPDPTPPTPDPAQWLVANTTQYLTNPTQRRAWLEASLWRPDLPYARQRLDAYALPDGGWDLLPEQTTTTTPISTDATPRPPRTIPLDPPTHLAAWHALGKRVFHELPMRRDTYIEWLITRPDLWPRAGLTTTPTGDLAGLVRYTDPHGQPRIGITCALCHAGDDTPGQAARHLDLGWARAQFAQTRGRTPGPYAHWGPGKVDVTDDAIDDPIAITDLWTLPWQTHLNTSGVIHLATPAALPIRFETQYITGHAYATRPPRVLTWALAIYLLTLDPPRSAPPTDHPGQPIFAQRCAPCHDPARGYAGDLISPEGFITDPSPAYSPMRGTGYLKIPGLINIAAGSPYLHDASFATLTDLITAGHPYGTPIPPDMTAQLVDFLNQL